MLRPFCTVTPNACGSAGQGGATTRLVGELQELLWTISSGRRGYSESPGS